MALTDAEARNPKSGDNPYKLADEKGLFLLVHQRGSKYRRLKYRLAGNEKLFAIGVNPETTLAAARAAASDV